MAEEINEDLNGDAKSGLGRGFVSKTSKHLHLPLNTERMHGREVVPVYSMLTVCNMSGT